MTNTLFLRLEGPMQSWGERGRWSERDTAREPTKSGVVGLLGCALGLKSDEDLLSLSRSIQMGVRCDRPGVVLPDFHTVFGGVLSAEGKIKINANTHEPETVVSHREYLYDASFLVALQGKPDLLSQLAQGLQNPVWPIYLGRKSCIPTRPVMDGEGDFDTLVQALQSHLFDGAEGEQVRVRAVMECSPDQGVQRRHGVDSNSRRTFLPTYTREILMDVVARPREER